MRTTEDHDRLVTEIAGLCSSRGLHVGVVESLTSGALASALGRGEDAAAWFRGAIVAYQSHTKVSLLDADEGADPCSPDCARQLAASGRELLESDVCVAVTGVGGPDPTDGHRPGEVHVGVATDTDLASERYDFDGPPGDIVEASVAAALRTLLESLRALSSPDLDEPTAQPHRGADIRITPLRVSDAGEVLTVQRAAFVSEAQLYGSADTAPLTQTLEQLEAELSDTHGWAARRGTRLVGALRARENDDVLLIGRIAIAPDVQGEGIGRKLLSAAESASSCAFAELFTGSLSEANIRLYRDCGYEETERIDQGDGTAQVFMRKRLS